MAAIGSVTAAPAPDTPRHRQSRSAEPHAPAAPFPAMRGLLLGASAGLVVGGASAVAVVLVGPTALNFVAPAPILSPLPMGFDLSGLPDTALQLALPALLGSMSGFIAAAAGSPSRQDRPLRLIRTVSFSMLAGLACGLVTSLSVGEGLKVWPIASWMRDLIAVGLITTALNKLVPQPRS